LEKHVPFDYRNLLQSVYTDLIEEIYREDNLIAGLEKKPSKFLKLLNADGVVVLMNKHIEFFGKVPAGGDIENLILWLHSTHFNSLYVQPSLPFEYEPAGKFARIASGILVLPIQGEKGNFILAFRPEEVRKVNRGGDPGQAIQFEPDKKIYHPGNSFKLWQQTVRHTAVPLKKEEVVVAEQFRNFVV
jgi:chemotaxis family two-component system sensor kinase Cph1